MDTSEGVHSTSMSISQPDSSSSSSQTNQSNQPAVMNNNSINIHHQHQQQQQQQQQMRRLGKHTKRKSASDPSPPALHPSSSTHHTPLFGGGIAVGGVGVVGGVAGSLNGSDHQMQVDADGHPLKKTKPSQSPLGPLTRKEPFVFGGMTFNQERQQFMNNLASFSQPNHSGYHHTNSRRSESPPPPPPPPSLMDDVDGTEDEEDGAFDDLLNTFAAMEFPDAVRAECPICAKKMRMFEFASHVYKCAERLDSQDPEAQLKRDERTAMALVTGDDAMKDWVEPSGVNLEPSFASVPKWDNGRAGFGGGSIGGGYEADFQTKCPVCNKMLVLGTAINQHINECLDASIHMPASPIQMASEQKVSDLAMDDVSSGGSGVSGSGSSNGFAVPSFNNSSQILGGSANPFSSTSSSQMMDDGEKDGEVVSPTSHVLASKQQLAACAKLLVQEEKGSEKYNDLLNSFKQLGLTKQNLEDTLHQ